MRQRKSWSRFLGRCLERVYLAPWGLMPDMTCLMVRPCLQRPWPEDEEEPPTVLGIELVLHLPKGARFPPGGLSAARSLIPSRCLRPRVSPGAIFNLNLFPSSTRKLLANSLACFTSLT